MTLYTKQFSDFYLLANLKGGANTCEYVRYNRILPNSVSKSYKLRF